MSTPFKRITLLCKALEVTSKKKEKIRLLADFFKSINAYEVSPAALLIIGTIFPEFDARTLDVGWSTVQKIMDRGGQTSLFKQQPTILHIYRTLLEVANKKGKGSRRVREQLLEGLMNSMSYEESQYFARILFGEMRIGVSEGVMLEGIAEAADVPLSSVRRALMMTGNIGKVAEIAIGDGKNGIDKIDLSLFVPLKPMLANMILDTAEAIEELGGKTAFEYKYDGARIQIHRKSGQIKIFSRRLSEVTESLPDIVDLIHYNIPIGDLILEGEILAIGENDRPLPFQDLMRRFTRVQNVGEMIEKIPLRLFLFDLLFYEGKSLINESYSYRSEKLEKITPKELLTNKMITDNKETAHAFLVKALEEGHEGLMAKRLDSIYSPGSRGKNWLKIKQFETLDVVVVAADWGSGRRQGWLSNYHLGVWNGKEYLVIGKTFKGLTDTEFKWITEHLQRIKISETTHTVHGKPELVIEVAFNEIQKSPQYKSGFALRFARIKKIREDKSPLNANTLANVSEMYEKQFIYKDKLK
jgi:DNA ligase-1